MLGSGGCRNIMQSCAEAGRETVQPVENHKIWEKKELRTEGQKSVGVRVRMIKQQIRT